MYATKSNPLSAEIDAIEPVDFTTGIQTLHLGHIDDHDNNDKSTSVK